MKILVCGGGALGSHLVYLSRSLPETEWAVVDFDRVETKNLWSQWFVKPMIGKNKATALKLQCRNFFGQALRDYPVRLESTNVDTILGDHDLVVDCLDNAASRRLVQETVRRSGQPCLHGGLAADGAFGVVRWDRDFVIDAEDAPGQPTCEGGEFLPLIVGVSRALAASLRAFLDPESRESRQWNVTPQGADSFLA